MQNDIAKLLENRKMVQLIDDLSKRYGKLPHETINTSIEEFNFNVSIMVISRIEESKINSPEKKDIKELKGFEKIIKKKAKT